MLEGVYIYRIIYCSPTLTNDALYLHIKEEKRKTDAILTHSSLFLTDFFSESPESWEVV
jgi:hypothetical protein